MSISDPRRLQFGLLELVRSVTLLALALGYGRLIVGIRHQLGFPLGPMFVVLTACGIGCLLASIGVLFRRGMIAAVYGAIIGASIGLGYYALHW